MGQKRQKKTQKTKTKYIKQEQTKKSNFEMSDYFRRWVEYVQKQHLLSLDLPINNQRQILFEKVGSNITLTHTFNPETILLVLDYLYMPPEYDTETENETESLGGNNIAAVTECELCGIEIVGHILYVENVLADPHSPRLCDKDKNTEDEEKISIITQLVKKHNYDMLANIMLCFLKMDIPSMVGFVGSLSYGLRMESAKIGSDFGLPFDDISCIFNKSTIINLKTIPIPRFLRLPVLQKSNECDKQNKYYPCVSTRCLEKRREHHLQEQAVPCMLAF